MEKLDYPRLGERCYREKLLNGLSVYVFPKPGFSRAFALMAVHYGGEDTRFLVGRKPRNTPAGVAHFLEHKMFDMPDENAMQTLSVRGAAANAFTSSDMTAYYFSCTEQFEENLRTLLNFVTTPYFTEESVAKEQGIIGQEIRMIEDDPARQVRNDLLHALYVNHPIRNSVAGSISSIAKITPKLLSDCHRAFYQRDNTVLCVAGNVDVERTLLLATAAQFSGPRSPERDHGAQEPPTVKKSKSVRKMEVAAPTFLLGFKAPPKTGMQYRLTGELAAELMAGESSPLYAELYQKGLIDKSFGASFESDAEIAHFVFGGDSPDPEAVAEALLREAERLEREGISDTAFRRTRKALYGSRVRALNSFEHLCVQTARSHFEGECYADFSACYDLITRTEVEALLHEAICADRASLAVIRPKAETEAKNKK